MANEVWVGNRSGASVAPARNFLKPFGAGLLEQPDAMAGMLELVDIGPDLRLPAVVVDGAGPASGAPGVEFPRGISRPGRLGLQFDEDAADFFNVVVLAYYVFVTQQITESQFAGFTFGLRAGMKWAIFGPQLFR